MSQLFFFLSVCFVRAQMTAGDHCGYILFLFFSFFFFFSLMVATVGRKKLFGAEQIEKLRQFPTSSDSDPRST